MSRVRLFPPPTLRECRHRRLARRLVAVKGADAATQTQMRSARWRAERPSPFLLWRMEGRGRPFTHPATRGWHPKTRFNYSVGSDRGSGEDYTSSHAAARAGPPRPAFPAFLAGAGPIGGWLGHLRREIFARAGAMPGVAMTSMLDQHLSTAPAAERATAARTVGGTDHFKRHSCFQTSIRAAAGGCVAHTAARMLL
jgi:hypothetical protein